MSAATAEAVPSSQPASAPVTASARPALVPDPSTPVVDDRAQLAAEVSLFRRAVIGAAIGAVLCAAIWVGLVAIAIVGNGTPLVSTLAMAAGCGVFAGIFLGGCAGALAGSHALEQVEHERMHAARHAG